MVGKLMIGMICADATAGKNEARKNTRKPRVLVMVRAPAQGEGARTIVANSAENKKELALSSGRARAQIQSRKDEITKTRKIPVQRKARIGSQLFLLSWIPYGAFFSCTAPQVVRGSCFIRA